MDNIKDMEREFESKSIVDTLQRQIKELKKENLSLKKTMEEYGIDEITTTSDVEYICLKGIADLKQIADGHGLSTEDAKILDLLHKNYRLARGQVDKKELKGKKQTVEELLKIVSDV